MWFDCTKTALKRLKIAYNNSLRRVMLLPWRNSVTEMFVNLGINSFAEMLRIYMFGLRSRVTTSYNQSLSSLCSETELPIVVNIQSYRHGGTVYCIL